MKAVPSQPSSLSDRFHSRRTFSWTAGRTCRSKKFMVLMPRSTPSVNTRRGVVVRIAGPFGLTKDLPIVLLVQSVIHPLLVWSSPCVRSPRSQAELGNEGTQLSSRRGGRDG